MTTRVNPPKLTRWRCPPVPEGQAAVTLTPRQAEVLYGLCEGLSNDQITRRLYVSEDTVKSHVKAVLRALKARDRTQAAVYVLTGRVVVFVRGTYEQERAA